MRRLFTFFLLILMFSSCSPEIYRVVKYSNYNEEQEEYYEYNDTDNQYYVIKNSNYYYILSNDSIIHYKKIDYKGKKGGYDMTHVRLDNGKELILEAVLEQGYFNDKYVYVNVIDYNTKKKLYRFVLDWDDKVEEELIKNKLAKID